MEMPETGRPWAEVKAELIARGDDDANWRDGKTAVYVFNAGEDISQIGRAHV
jgi:sphinganine-1-phosphate aldolase